MRVAAPPGSGHAGSKRGAESEMLRHPGLERQRCGPAPGGGLDSRRMDLDPASLRIVHFPDPALRAPAKPVPAVTDAVRAVAARLIELMHEAEGIGLAAPQVAAPWRLFVCHVPPGEDRPVGADPPQSTEAPLVCINPELTEFSDELEVYDEGCLSLPDITGDVRRPRLVTLTATGLDGARFTLRADGLLARCIQHEYDHLDGVLIIDKMQTLSRMKNRRAVRDLERQVPSR